MYVNEVAISFLRSMGRILLIKRKDRFSGREWRWDGISVLLDKGDDPKQKAIEEIKKRTKLAEKDIEFLREEAAFSFRGKDDESETKWLVHPFLFRVKKKGIKIDKKSFDTKWMIPSEADKYFTVPGLSEALKRLV